MQKIYNTYTSKKETNKQTETTKIKNLRRELHEQGRENYVLKTKKIHVHEEHRSYNAISSSINFDRLPCMLDTLSA